MGQQKKHRAHVPKWNVNLSQRSLHASVAFRYWSISNKGFLRFQRLMDKGALQALSMDTAVVHQKIMKLSTSLNANSELALNHRIAISNRLQTLRPDHIGGQISLAEADLVPVDFLLGTLSHRCEIAFECRSRVWTNSGIGGKRRYTSKELKRWKCDGTERMLKVESWTKQIGLRAHTEISVAWFGATYYWSLSLLLVIMNPY